MANYELVKELLERGTLIISVSGEIFKEVARPKG